MPWSYSGDPGSSSRDSVRFLTGDTDTADQQLTDQEVDWILELQPDIYEAAKVAVRGLISKYSRLVDMQIGDLRKSYSQRVKHYKDLLSNLDNIAAELGSTTAIPAPYAGGISISDRQVEQTDSDRVDPEFYVGMDDTYDTSNNEDYEEGI